jgi:hypothetical protein
VSKASKGRLWFQNRFVDMRTADHAYHDTLEALAFALSTEKVDWLLGPIAGWSVVLNTPIECGINAMGKIVGRHQLWNCAEKTRWMADPERYGHILTKAYVEHPYEKQRTKSYIIEGVKAATARGMPTRDIAVQVVEIIDSRLDCVLLPSDGVKDHPHMSIAPAIGTGLDGMVAKYSKVALEDHSTGSKVTLADLQSADDDMQRRVEKAMTTLVGQPWLLLGRSVAAMSKPYGTIAPAKTSNAATQLQVTNHDVQQVINKMGLTWRQPPKDLDNGWSLYGPKGVVFSGLKADAMCRLVDLTAKAVGSLQVPGTGSTRLSRLTREQYKLLVQQHYGVVY